jgi:uncharacterized protein (DUF302 family)
MNVIATANTIAASTSRLLETPPFTLVAPSAAIRGSSCPRQVRETCSQEPFMPDWIVTKSSPRSVPDTVQRMSELASAKGLELFIVIDHSGEAAAHGLELRDTKVVVFGSPVAGTPVMQTAPLAALDLPLKILVWDEDGQTRVSYTAPSELGARYGLSDELAARLAGIDGLTDALVSA